ncbi:MAG: hypothetical protein GC137_10005 [Alphaproteobacteria bacterium]|nr:hypothetical protein [Alphaproteobacteria bacterium]
MSDNSDATKRVLVDAPTNGAAKSPADSGQPLQSSRSDEVVSEPMNIRLRATFNLKMNAAFFYAKRIRELMDGIRPFDLDADGKPETFVIGDANSGGFVVNLTEVEQRGRQWVLRPLSRDLREAEEKMLFVDPDADIEMVKQDAATRLAIIEADKNDQTDLLMAAIIGGKIDKYIEVTTAELVHGSRKVDVLSGRIVPQKASEEESGANEPSTEEEEHLRKQDINPKRPMMVEGTLSLDIKVERLYGKVIDEFVSTVQILEYEKDAEGSDIHDQPITALIGNADMGIVFEIRREDDYWSLSPFRNDMREDGEPYILADLGMEFAEVAREAAKRATVAWAEEFHQGHFLKAAFKRKALRDNLILEHATLKHGQRVVNIGDGVEDEERHESHAESHAAAQATKDGDMSQGANISADDDNDNQPAEPGPA